MTIQLTDTNQNSLLISAVNLELFAFRATHRLLQYIVKKINQPDLILSFEELNT